MWHIGRMFDDLAFRQLEGGHAEDQVWFAGGWAVNTAYDPRGVGWQGAGMLAGYTAEEVACVPLMSADDLLAYYDQTREALAEAIAVLSEEALHESASGLPDDWWTCCRTTKVILMNAYEHAGEIKAMRAMWVRQHGPLDPMSVDWSALG